MKTTEVTLRFIEPSEGYVLRNKEDKTILSKKVSLSSIDKIENWEEVEESVGISEKEEIEELYRKKYENIEEYFYFIL